MLSDRLRRHRGSCDTNGAIDRRLDRPDLQRIGAVHFTGITRLGSEVVRGGYSVTSISMQSMARNIGHM